MNAKPIDIKKLKPEIEKRIDKTHKLGYRGAYVSTSSKGIPNVRICLLGETYTLSRVLWCVDSGRAIPEGMIIDHEDGNPLNNDINNLRLASYKTNNWNKKRQKNNKSGVGGVCYVKDKGLWSVNFGQSGGKRVCFADFFEAVCYRKSMENQSTRITERHGS